MLIFIMISIMRIHTLIEIINYYRKNNIYVFNTFDILNVLNQYIQTTQLY